MYRQKIRGWASSYKVLVGLQQKVCSWDDSNMSLDSVEATRPNNSKSLAHSLGRMLACPGMV